VRSVPPSSVKDLSFTLPPDGFVRLAGPTVGKMLARMFCVLSVLLPHALPLLPLPAPPSIYLGLMIAPRKRVSMPTPTPHSALRPLNTPAESEGHDRIANSVRASRKEAVRLSLPRVR